MTAVDDAFAAVELRPIAPADLEALMAIEVRCYAYPWSRGNFVDSIAAGYWAMGLWSRSGPDEATELAGYCWAMEGVEELHLLNITVAPEQQRRGHAWRLLDELCAFGRRRGASCVWLEVRASNEAARRLYARYGFEEAGLRRRYYPAARSQREDAVLMRLTLSTAGDLPALPCLQDTTS